MATIISLVQVKGGCGRSTIATNLAGYLSGEGKRVALLDADMPQGTSASWGAIRQGDPARAGAITIATAVDHLQMIERAEQLAGDHDYLVIDSPPRIAEMTRAALILSDLCLIPLGASAAEVWATSDLLETINEALAVKPSVDARILWTRFRGNTKSAQELSSVAKSELGLRELKNKLGYRVAYPEALARGLTVLEWPERTARVEFQAVAKEVQQITRRKA